jgi:hypothetical protein
MQHQPERMPRCECPFVPADVDGVDRTPAVLQVALIDAATTMVLHVGCTGRRGQRFGEVEPPANGGGVGLARLGEHYLD